MDSYILILLAVGILLLFVTSGSGWIKRLPFSFALIYLIFGVILGPYGLNLIQVRPDTKFIERLSELVVLISLFSCGLKMNRPFKLKAWRSTLRLIGLLMPITIFTVAAVAHWGLKLDWGTGVLMGAILAPTDPVLASEVQLSNPEDFDELRFGLTSEGGLNDSLAFPFVYFGLHWLENKQWQSWIGSWIAVDLLWAILSAIVMGILIPSAVVAIDKRIQKSRPSDELMQDFIALGVVLITYAATELVNGYGFLAVFVAGIVTQRKYHNPEKRLSQIEFTETIEKLLEVATILILGSLLRAEPLQKYLLPGLVIAGSLIFIIRPIGVWISFQGQRQNKTQRWLLGWFGIRGVGSIYYLTYALSSSLKGPLGEQIAWITIITVISSIVIHGITSTPLMYWYEQRFKQSAV